MLVLKGKTRVVLGGWRQEVKDEINHVQVTHTFTTVT